MRICLGAIICMLATCSTALAVDYDFFVSPGGNDRNPGTEARPFATLDKARLAVRKLKKTKKTDISVGLKGGKYVLRKSVVFTAEDSGSAKQKISYVGLPGEQVILTSEEPVKGWAKADALPKGVPPQAGGNFWSAPLPEDAGRVKYLFKGDSVLPRSMTKGFIPAKRYATWAGSKGHNTREERTSMVVPSGIISDWKGVKDIELVILPTCDWIVYNLPLESYDPKTRKVTTGIEQKYALGAQKKRTWKGPTAWLANCPEGMREEGNWYVNTRENRIYLLSEAKPEAITVPTLLEYIRVEGTKESEADHQVQNLHFSNLIFTKGKRFTWPDGERRLGQFWEEPVACAAVRLVNAKNCSITGSRFEHLGGDAIRIMRASVNNRIEGNLIRRVGGSGVCIAGYASETKGVSSGNEVIGNHIHHTGEAYWGAPAISIFLSSKNRIAHNLIHHTPYNGIRLGGHKSLLEKNVVEYNELHHVVELLGDGNAFYIRTNGNVIRYNYIHDMSGNHASSAMRTDGLGTCKNVSFIGNIVYNVAKGGLVLKGPEHKVVNNVFVDCYNKSSAKTWEGGPGWLEFRAGPSNGSLIKDNVFLDTIVGNAVFINAKFKMPKRFKHPIKVEDMTLSGNVFDSKRLNAAESRKLLGELNKLGFTGFADREISAISIKDGRVVLNPKGKLFNDGYEFIDMSKIGLPKTFPKAWLAYDEGMPMRKYFKNRPWAKE